MKNSKNLPKVLIGCPMTSKKRESTSDYIKGLKNLSYKNFEVLLVDNSPDNELDKYFKNETTIKVKKSKNLESVRRMLVRDRNLLREYALKNEFDYFFSLEQDVVPPKNVIERLLSHEKKVCSGVYFNNVLSKQVVENKSVNFIDLMPVCFDWKNPKVKDVKISRRMTFDEIFPARLMRVHMIGLGCVLIHKDVLEKVEFRTDEMESFDDMFFSVDCQNNGFEIWVDSGVVCKHVGSE